MTRPSTPPPSPPRNLRLTGFVLQKYRSQTATGKLTNRKSEQTIPPPLSLPWNLRLMDFVLRRTLTNSNRNAHKLQQERSQTGRVTRSPNLPPLLHEISGSPVLFCKYTAHNLRQERSQIRIVTKPYPPSPPFFKGFSEPCFVLTNKKSNHTILYFSLTSIFPYARSKIDTRALTNGTSDQTLRPSPSMPGNLGLIGFLAKTTAHKSQQKAHKTMSSKSKTGISFSQRVSTTTSD